MNSGLYALAGASATATAAAFANRLLEPMTNVSKVYFLFSRDCSPDGRAAVPVAGSAAQLRSGNGSAWVAGCGLSSGVSPGRSSGRTVTAIRISRPRAADSAPVSCGRSLVSSTSLANSLGAASSAVSSTRPSGRVNRRNARCCGLTALSARLSTALPHTDSRSGSSGTAAPPGPRRRVSPRRLSTALSTPCAHPRSGAIRPRRGQPGEVPVRGTLTPGASRSTRCPQVIHTWLGACGRCRGLVRPPTGGSPGWVPGWVADLRFDLPRPAFVPLTDLTFLARPGDRPPAAGCGEARPPKPRWSPDREQAHLPAEQPPPCPYARFPAADADPRGTRHSRSPPSQGPRQALGLTDRTVLPAAVRMRRSDDFARAVRRGRRAGRGSLVVHYLPPELAPVARGA